MSTLLDYKTNTLSCPIFLRRYCLAVTDEANFKSIKLRADMHGSILVLLQTMKGHVSFSRQLPMKNIICTFCIPADLATFPKKSTARQQNIPLLRFSTPPDLWFLQGFKLPKIQETVCRKLEQLPESCPAEI